MFVVSTEIFPCFLDCTPGIEQGLGQGFARQAGVLILELDWAPVSECGVEPARVVDLVDEVRKVGDDVGERLIVSEIDGLNFERFHEALGLGIVIRVAPPPH